MPRFSKNEGIFNLYIKKSMPKSKTRAASLRGNRNAVKPAEEHRVALSVSVSREVFAEIEKLAEREQVNKGRALDILIRRAMKRDA